MQIPIIRARKPPFGSIPRVNYGNPIADGIIGCYLPGLLRGQPVIGGVILADGNDGKGERALTRDGLALKTGAGLGNRGLIGVAPTNFKSGTGFTIQWRGVLHSNCDAFAQLIAVTYNDGDDNPYFVWGITTDYLGYETMQTGWNTNGLQYRTNVVDVRSHYGKMVDFVATFRVNGNSTFYVNGVQVEQALYGFDLPTSANSRIVINQYVAGVGRSASASCNIATFWDRELTPSEVQALTIDPYCFLQYPEDEIFATLKGGGAAVTHYTMAAGLGTITLAGQPAVLRRTRKMAAGLGTLTAAGQPAVLRVTRKTTAGLGTLTLSGQPAVLTYSRKIKMAAGLGVLTPSGQATNLVYSGAGSKTMLAGLGTITLSGQPVTVRYARKMPAGLGTITLAGQPATLTYSRKIKMAAGLGTLTLSGQPAVLRYARKMAAGLGTLTIAGQPATLTYSRKIKMAAGLGVLTLAGQNATLTKASSSARVMAAGLGTITIAGQPVTVRYARKMPASLGTLTLSGQPVGLRRAKRLAATVGNINMVGQSAILTYAHAANIRMVAGVGTLVLAGQSVGLNRVTTLAGQPGVLNFGRRVTINRW